MDCIYKYKGASKAFNFLKTHKDYTYQELAEALKENLSKLTDIQLRDFLYQVGEQDTMVTLYDKINRVIIEERANRKENFVKSQNNAVYGEPDVSHDNKVEITVNELIESEDFVISYANNSEYEDEPVMPRLDASEYVDTMKRAYVASGEMTQEEANAWGETVQSNWELISDNALDFHNIIAGSAKKVADNIKNTSFETVQSQVETAIDDIWKQVRYICRGSQVIKNVPLRVELPSIGKDLLGHIDFVVIRPQQNGRTKVDIVNIKTSIEQYDKWSEVKKEKYKYQMALLKQMLASKGINADDINLHIIPVQIQYNESFNAVSTIKVNNAINIDMHNTQYDFSKYDIIAQKFVPTTVSLPKVTDAAIERANVTLSHIFPNSNIHAQGVDLSIEEWVNKNWKKTLAAQPLKNNEGWSFLDPNTGERFTVKDTRQRARNEELIAELKKRNIDTNGRSAYILRDEISRMIRDCNPHNSLIDKNPSLEYIVEKYAKDYTETEEGKRISNWQVIENSALYDTNIILLRNKHSGQLDVISLSDYDLSVQRESNYDNLLSDHGIKEVNKYNFTLRNTYANIEAMRTLAVLNEVIPNIDGSIRLGKLNMVSVNNYVRQTGRFYDFDDILSQWRSVIKIVNTVDSGAQIEDGFANSVCVDPVDILYQTWQNIVSQPNTAFEDILDLKTLFEGGKLQVDGTNIGGLMSMTKFDDKISGLKQIIERLKELAINKGIRLGEINESTYLRKENSIKGVIMKLYLVATEALSKMYGDIDIDIRRIAKWQEWLLKPNVLGDANVRRCVNIIRSTVDQIGSEVLFEFSNVVKDFNNFYKASGYTVLQNAVIGNQASVFKNLFEHDENGNIIYEFKNPFDPSTDLKPHERQFLKNVLYEFYKVRCRMKGMKVDINGPEDPILRTKMPKNYLFVPIQRSSKNTRRAHPGQMLRNLKKTVDTMFSKDFPDIVAGIMTQQDRNERNFSLKTLGIHNNYTISESEMHRDEYIQNFINKYGEGSIETNVENILIGFLCEQVRTTRMQDALVRINAIEFALKIQGLTEYSIGEAKDIENVIRVIEEFKDYNVYNLSTLDNFEKGIDSITRPFRQLVTKFYIMANLGGEIRDLSGGPIISSIYTAIGSGPSGISLADLRHGYSTIYKDVAKSIGKRSLYDLLNAQYAFSNFDQAHIASRLMSERGALDFETLAFKTMSTPDYINRLAIAIAKLHSWGAEESLSVVDGVLKYNWKLDKRFSIYASGDTSNPEYNKQRAAYMSRIREYNRENPNMQITYDGDLPEVFLQSEVQEIKSLAERIYGAYDKASRAKIFRTTIGNQFFFFASWMNGLMESYTKPAQTNFERLQMLQETDRNGNLLFFTPDGTGETTTENTDLPVIKTEPTMTRGVIYTLKDAAKSFWHRDWKQFKNDLWQNDVDRINTKRLFADLLVTLLFSILVAGVAKPAYKRHKKEMDGQQLATNMFMELMYRGGIQSLDIMSGPLAMFEYVADSTRPLALNLQTKLLSDAFKTLTGKKDFYEWITGMSAISRSVRDSLMAYHKVGTA